MIPPKLFVSLISCGNKFHRFGLSFTWRAFPPCLCYLCRVTLISSSCVLGCQLSRAGFLRRSVFLWAELITLSAAPPVIAGFTRTSTARAVGHSQASAFTGRGASSLETEMCPAVLGSWKHGQIAVQEQQRRLGCFGDCFGISSLQSLALFCLYSLGCVWAHPSWGKSYSIKAGFLPAMCVHPRLFFGSSKLPFQEKLKQYHCTAHAALFCKERAFHSLSKGNTDRYSSFTPISVGFQLRC